MKRGLIKLSFVSTFNPEENKKGFLETYLNQITTYEKGFELQSSIFNTMEERPLQHKSERLISNQVVLNKGLKNSMFSDINEDPL